MSVIKLKTNGDYRGIDEAVNKRFVATKTRAGWIVPAAALRKAGATPCIHEYLFLNHEVTVCPV